MKIIMTLTAIIIIGGIITYLFPLAKVHGVSMYPTLQEGDIILCNRLNKKLRDGDIYVFSPPDSNRLSIKRLLFVHADHGTCFFRGDNPAESYDSRHYGYINTKNIVAKVSWHPKHQITEEDNIDE